MQLVQTRNIFENSHVDPTLDRQRRGKVRKPSRVEPTYYNEILLAVGVDEHLS